MSTLQRDELLTQSEILGLASQGLSSFLSLEGTARPTGTTCHFPWGARSDQQDVPRESFLGCTTDPRWAPEARHRYRW